ncbi:MAG: YicC/YloC family endoribonuclease, partial [Phycisphaeraceae bacterium]|nr:YicC/YloC family endoribonuclease [Phycisphaeraceae bacterium]
MIRSMTGFGAASADHAGVHHAVELRSVNNRYFKPRLRLPDALSALEADLEKRLRQHIHRGSVTLTVQVRDQTAEAAHEVNEPAMLAYLEHLETIRSRLDADQPVQIDLTALMNLPGVLQPVADHGQRAEQSAEIVHDLVEQACEQLTTMRRREGEALIEELTSFGREIAERLEVIEKRAPEVARAYHQR